MVAPSGVFTSTLTSSTLIPVLFVKFTRYRSHGTGATQVSESHVSRTPLTSIHSSPCASATPSDARTSAATNFPPHALMRRELQLSSGKRVNGRALAVPRWPPRLQGGEHENRIPRLPRT